MAKIQIIIKGIAISYHKGDGIWKIIFPFEIGGGSSNLHDVRLTVGSGRTQTLAEAGRTVTITTVNPVSSFAEGDGYEDFLDLTADYSHEDGISGKSGWQDRAIILSMENAAFSLYEMTASRYLLKLNGVTTKNSDYIGYSGIAEIEAEQVKIEITGLNDVILEDDVTVIFDNTCEIKTPSDNSDFQMIYYAVEDEDTPSKIFTLERDPQDMPPDTDSDAESRDNPAPGQRGLPCNKVRVSKPGSLP